MAHQASVSWGIGDGESPICWKCQAARMSCTYDCFNHATPLILALYTLNSMRKSPSSGQNHADHSSCSPSVLTRKRLACRRAEEIARCNYNLRHYVERYMQDKKEGSFHRGRTRNFKADLENGTCKKGASPGFGLKSLTLAIGSLGFAGSASAAPSSIFGNAFDVSGPGSIAGALGVLAAIITVHETGHFLAARSRNIHVQKFSIGFGPALWKYKGEKVEYSLRAIPLGGFVGFPDDDPESEFKPDDPDLLRNRSIQDRLLVISAGIIANCIFAFSILFVQASTVGMASATILPGVRVPKVVPGSAADVAGIRKGDVIVAVGDRPLSSSKENVNNLVQYIKDHPEKRLLLKVARNDSLADIPVMTELAADGDGKIGVQLATYAKLSRQVANGPADAAVRASNEFGRMCGLVGSGLYQILTNFSQSKQAVSGPLAIVAAGAEVARNDAASLFQFAAIVNINLALVNALPLPALDGGYILLLLVEAVRGKKLDKIVEQAFMASGFLLLTGLGVLLVVRDALNLGQSLM